MTSYAHITNGVIDQVGPLPMIYYDGSSWWDFRPGQRNPSLAGWLPVTSVQRPVDTTTDTYTLSFALVGGVPTEVWTARPWSAEELSSRTAATNNATIQGSIQTVDMVAMATILAATNASLKTDPGTSIKDLARAVRRLDRVVARMLDATD